MKNREGIYKFESTCEITNTNYSLNLKNNRNLAKSWVPKNCTGTDFPPASLPNPLRSTVSDSSTTIAGHMA